MSNRSSQIGRSSNSSSSPSSTRVAGCLLTCICTRAPLVCHLLLTRPASSSPPTLVDAIPELRLPITPSGPRLHAPVDPDASRTRPITRASWCLNQRPSSDWRRAGRSRTAPRDRVRRCIRSPQLGIAAGSRPLPRRTQKASTRNLESRIPSVPDAWAAKVENRVPPRAAPTRPPSPLVRSTSSTPTPSPSPRVRATKQHRFAWTDPTIVVGSIEFPTSRLVASGYLPLYPRDTRKTSRPLPKYNSLKGAPSPSHLLRPPSCDHPPLPRHPPPPLL